MSGSTSVATPQYPDVPQAPGVPAVFRAPAQAPLLGAILLTADVLDVVSMFGLPQWGIYTTDGQIVAIPDNVVSVDHRREFRISDYPVEQGGFASYNKVALPFDVRVRMSVASGGLGGIALTGNVAARSAFLEALDAAATSLNLYAVITPEWTFPSVNIVHYDYRREIRSGVGMIVVDVWLEEVRQTGTSQFSQTQSPQGAAQQNDGTVQAQPATVQPAPTTAAAPSGGGGGTFQAGGTGILNNPGGTPGVMNPASLNL